MVKNLSRTEPNLVSVRLFAKNGTYRIASAAQAPLRVSFELNAEAIVPGSTPGRDQCGEVAFGLPPAVPACVFIQPGTLDCR
jgi:hypothetical protein